MFYKVVSTHDGELSSYVFYHGPRYHTKYEEGKWTSPNVKDTYLFVFWSLKELKAFLKKEQIVLPSDYYSVWECEVEDPKQLHIRAWGDFDAFWANYHNNCVLNSCPTPKGTIGVKRVKLTKKVELYDLL